MNGPSTFGGAWSCWNRPRLPTFCLTAWCILPHNLPLLWYLPILWALPLLWARFLPSPFRLHQCKQHYDLGMWTLLQWGRNGLDRQGLVWWLHCHCHWSCHICRRCHRWDIFEGLFHCPRLRHHFHYHFRCCHHLIQELSPHMPCLSIRLPESHGLGVDSITENR